MHCNCLRGVYSALTSICFANRQAHLGAHNFIHRDLAARNVLLGSGRIGSDRSGMVCKVADFGLSRRVQTEDNTGDYYRRYCADAIPQFCISLDLLLLLEYDVFSIL